jgi:GR25 family glycosyltransferase involved in LPS biosynthesis
MGPWMKHMRRFPATDGRLIDKRKWALTKKVVNSNMTPGRMGCYDSHVRIWESIARSPHPVVTVLEDDVDWEYSNAKNILNLMAQYFSELKTIQWDWLAWGHGPWAFGKNHPIPNLNHWRKPGTCQGFFAYTLTRSMAQKLLTKCYPYKGPAVDKWFYDDFIRQVPVNVFTAEPRLCWVVPVKSDTDTTKLRL